jgi:pyruvate/2-oxoglutarate dehydrogenase complex dihydrolipoamide acyltransferase (E2) component
MHALFLPRLGQTMDEGLLATWLVAVDEEFEVGTPLYEVETEKITTSVEATLAGRIVRIVVPADSTVAVGTVLAVVAGAGEAPTPAQIDAFVSGARPDDQAGAGHDPSAAASTEQVSAAPVSAAHVTGDGASGPVRAMPRTRALAREEGLAITEISGTGPGGLVIPADVHAATAAALAAAGADAPRRSPGSGGTTPLSLAHRRMAGTLATGMVPQFTQMIDADVTGWRAARAHLQGSAVVPLTFTDLILDAVVTACRAQPQVNASFAGDHLDLHHDVDITLAMDTPEGLMVPVLRRSQEQSLAGRARARHELTERARTGTLTVDDMGIGTITVSNLGAYGVPTGVPLLVAPYAAIVFVGSMEQRVVVRAGGIAVRTMCTLAISYDHRVVDGATAAHFTTALRDAVEALTAHAAAQQEGDG